MKKTAGGNGENHGAPAYLKTFSHTRSIPLLPETKTFIIFQSKRPGGYGKNDLYISFRKADGSWGHGCNMGPSINTAESDKCGRVTLDGKYFIFSRSREGAMISDFYWIDAGLIEKLQSKQISYSDDIEVKIID